MRANRAIARVHPIVATAKAEDNAFSVLLKHALRPRRTYVVLFTAFGVLGRMWWLSGTHAGTLGWAGPSLAIGAKLLPLYLVVILGSIAGRQFDIAPATVGTVLVRVVSPIMFFRAVAVSPVSVRDLALPALFLALPTGIRLVAHIVARNLIPGQRSCLAAFLAGSANVGSFGIPAVLTVLPRGALGTYMLCLFGFALYENTVAYFMLLEGRGGAKKSLRRAIRQPAAYAIMLGLAANWAGLSCGPELRALWAAFKGCYVVLGMLALGLRLAHPPALGETLRFMNVTTVARFVLWPLAAAGFVVANWVAASPFGPDVQRTALLFAALPCATSGAVFAVELGL